jgi:hypothetical protein
LVEIATRPFDKAGNMQSKVIHFKADGGVFVNTFCGTGWDNAILTTSWDRVTCKHCLHNRDARLKNEERVSTSTNKPKGKISPCYECEFDNGGCSDQPFDSSKGCRRFYATVCLRPFAKRCWKLRSL